MRSVQRNGSVIHTSIAHTARTRCSGRGSAVVAVYLTLLPRFCEWLGVPAPLGGGHAARASGPTCNR